MDEGYLFFSVDPVEVNIEGDSIDLEMRITEGSPATINRIIIKGNTKTNEHVIRREIRTVPGICSAKQILSVPCGNLLPWVILILKILLPNPIPNLADGTVTLNIHLKKVQMTSLKFPADGADMDLSEPLACGFPIFLPGKYLIPKHGDLFQQVTDKHFPYGPSQTADYYQAYNLSFVEPWFGGKKPNSFSTSFYYTVTNTLQQDFTSQIQG